jgi:hypothetical protein
MENGLNKEIKKQELKLMTLFRSSKGRHAKMQLLTMHNIMDSESFIKTE